MADRELGSKAKVGLARFGCVTLPFLTLGVGISTFGNSSSPILADLLLLVALFANPWSLVTGVGFSVDCPSSKSVEPTLSHCHWSLGPPWDLFFFGGEGVLDDFLDLLRESVLIAMLNGFSRVGSGIFDQFSCWLVGLLASWGGNFVGSL